MLEINIKIYLKITHIFKCNVKYIKRDSKSYSDIVCTFAHPIASSCGAFVQIRKTHPLLLGWPSPCPVTWLGEPERGCISTHSSPPQSETLKQGRYSVHNPATVPDLSGNSNNNSFHSVVCQSNCTNTLH